MEYVSPPSGPEEAERRRRFALLHRPPINELPSVAALEVVLGRHESLVLWLATALVYSSGLELDLRAVRRPGPLDQGSLSLNLTGRPSIGGAAAVSPILLGVEFADGRTATNLRPMGQPPGLGLDSVTADQPLLSPMSGSSSTTTAMTSYFVRPVPATGDLLVITAWPAEQMPETRVALDGNLIRDAGKRVRVLWLETELPDQTRYHRPGPPEVPPGGWFSRQV
jgi:hypothetical protein